MKAESSETDRQAAVRAARMLLRRSERGALATILSGAPYTSLTLVAADLDGTPLLLLSDLAQGARNLKADSRASLMVAAAPSGPDPLDSPRLSVLGRVEPTGEPRHRRRYLARQPHSSLYADFADFKFYRMVVERAHLVSGFGKVAWIKARDLLVTDAARGLEGAETALGEWLGRERSAELDLCANRLAGCAGTGWQVSGIDPDGIDLRRADEAVRLDFDVPVASEAACRAAFAALVEAADRIPGD